VGAVSGPGEGRGTHKAAAPPPHHSFPCDQRPSAKLLQSRHHSCAARVNRCFFLTQSFQQRLTGRAQRSAARAQRRRDRLRTARSTTRRRRRQPTRRSSERQPRTKKSNRRRGTPSVTTKSVGIRRQAGRGADGCCAVDRVGRSTLAQARVLSPTTDLSLSLTSLQQHDGREHRRCSREDDPVSITSSGRGDDLSDLDAIERDVVACVSRDRAYPIAHRACVLLRVKDDHREPV
jgi:hypothetical protein